MKDGAIHTEHMARLVRPLALGLLEEDEARAAAAQLNEMAIAREYRVGTGFLSTPFLLQTLARYGYVESAYAMLENTEAPGWLAMVEQGATTVWEKYIGFEENGSPKVMSYNHYSPGAVCAFLFDTVCGIRVDGKNHVTICPTPGGTLTWAKARTLTPCGIVESGWEKTENGYEYTLRIPANVTATLVLPDKSSEELEAGEHIRRTLAAHQ